MIYRISLTQDRIQRFVTIHSQTLQKCTFHAEISSKSNFFFHIHINIKHVLSNNFTKLNTLTFEKKTNVSKFQNENLSRKENVLSPSTHYTIATDRLLNVTRHQIHHDVHYALHDVNYATRDVCYVTFYPIPLK